MWLAIAKLVVTIALSFALAPKQKSADSNLPTVSDVEAPVSEDGKEIGVLFGTRDINAPNMGWWGDVAIVAIKSKGGGKK